METVSEVTEESKGADVVVQRTVDTPVKDVWNVLMTDEGAEIFLGPGARFGAKGEKWKSHDGREGVIRSFHPLEQIRFSWRRDVSKEPAMVTVDLIGESDDKTTIKITHSHDQDSGSRDWLIDRWEAALERIESECL